MSWSVRKIQTSNAAQVSGSNAIPLGRVVRAVPRGVGPDGKPKWVIRLNQRQPHASQQQHDHQPQTLIRYPILRGQVPYMRLPMPPPPQPEPQQNEIHYNIGHVFEENGKKVRKMPINLNGQTIWVDCAEQPLGDQNKRKMVVQADNPAPLQKVNNDECTICYEPRNPAYMFYPCGHATFCKNCASRLFEESEKKCPDCRRPIKDIVRVFQ